MRRRLSAESEVAEEQLEEPTEVCERDPRDGATVCWRIRDLVTLMAVTGRSPNEDECALIPIMARSQMKLHPEAGYIDAGPLAHHKITLATHGRSIHRVMTEIRSPLPGAAGGAWNARIWALAGPIMISNLASVATLSVVLALLGAG